ncbi:hypothetical protein COW94_04185 [Candidatus Peregrinibacteria bacterium CG22_combo_CG10-13_8_21_14_all_44_10]|nr:MAG: hypothetical protein AUK45_05305 [Candidatus Peregrinibacteria bacterium CG2_30_44_17]PIP65979.1 MAG: hypothetical protein COW94_04185 [Candidatus Peregrinibacteria bacterium CG22_combo_CG10-13_8_21_14_all_44_10]PIX79470.1 MAG: hypothetical protein COZ35_03445 [Candidatus Peregrinibacteria bacterium CG_4_10_14_3_um_filter_44_21]PJB88691.1 MAG: hypothetical protein CO082_03575 [Candidatus Peregrinibacteria bacterium CG_4_9_14_0_8_um_filter_44_15]
MPPGENLATDRVERGADRTIDRLQADNFKNVLALSGEQQRRMESLGKGIAELGKQGVQSPEIDSIRQRMERGEIKSFAEVMAAESIVKGIAMKKAEQELKDSIDPDEDAVLGHTKGWLKAMEGMDTTGVANEIKEIKNIKTEQAEHKKNVQALKAKSPRAFKAYLKELKKNKERGLMTKSKKDILKDTETTYSKAMKAPEAVQGEFFAKLDKGELTKDSAGETLKELEAQHKDMIAKYEKSLDDNVKIFGKKPVAEFKSWIAGRKNFAEIQWAQHVMDTDYLPKRQQVQTEFENMPDNVTKPHKEKWENDLGYSERRALLASLHNLEHQANNPMAQEYMQTLTNSPEEVAAKEWPKMTEDFLKHDYADQETLLKAYRLTEGRQRRELADRFKKLPDDVRQTPENQRFFTLDKEEKITLLSALEKDQTGADSTKDWQNMMQTESGDQAFQRALGMVTGRTRGQAVVLADIMGKKTYEDQMRTGVVDASDRQEKNIREGKGSRIGDKMELVHELTGEDTTINDMGQEQEFHTMDLDALNQGAMNESSVQAIRRELVEDGTITNDEKDTYSMARFVRRGSDNEIDLARNTDQRDNLEGMVKQMLMEALMMAVESMGGKPQREIAWDDLSEEQSKAMLGHYQEMTKMQFKGLEGISTMKKAA